MRGAWQRAAVAGAVVVVMAACGGGGAGTDYPAEVTDNFLASCTRAGTTEAVCQCALDKLEDKYSIEEFTQEAVRLQQGQPSDEFSQDIVSFSLECQQEAG
ncbi:MAG TPA: hypothetical protein VHL78_02215 [Actinomycetota bacterium]|nr:hypothetical protein [Actinomycetota bacterium]